MKIGDKIIIREEGAFFGEEGIISELPKAELKGQGFDLSVPAEHQTAVVKIFGGVLGVFIKPSDLELI
jgi:hypothetical protein